ncbi:uncharacterized protein LOC115033155 [Acyrthosiphon pisum]|uniref:Uncharacterized protein n=1 Tax=Acyrthosiphon pisum TaxID=7029 RepID=A0A8R2NJT9_ACYPI|nr:uncharacterized protein LOC115033155 [Acyrthosiphon pisum]
MNNNELIAFIRKGVLKWNFVEDISDIEEEQNNDTEKYDGQKSILEEIFPPRVWTRIVNNNNKVITLRQTISREPSNRDGVQKMIVMLNHLEQFFRFKKKGICEIRNSVHNLFFGNLKHIPIYYTNIMYILWFYKLHNVIIYITKKMKF